MDRRVVALLVGIDSYPAPVPPLRGCGPDVSDVADHLRATVPEGALDLQVLLDSEATRDGVVTAFRDHLAQAGPAETALFYFSGHGSQQARADSTELSQTLVLFDSRSPGGWDLVDTELGTLVGEVAETAGHVLVVLDCCHSGSGTRAVLDDETRVRRAPTDPRVRPPETLLGPASGPVARGTSGWVATAAPHVLLAACRSDETAKETLIGGSPHGVLSAALLTALTEVGPTASYRDLHRYVAARARGTVRDQNPQLETATPADLDRTFLGGSGDRRREEVTLTWVEGTGWTLDAGAIHGIPPADSPVATELAVLAVPGGERVGDATVRHVEPGRSLADVVPADLDRSRPYRVRVTASSLAPVTVAVLGADPEPLRAGVTADAGPDALLALVSDGSAQLVAETGPDGIRLRRPAATRPDVGLFHDVDSAVAALRHVALWLRVAGLNNPATGLPSEVLTVEPSGGQLVDGRYVVAYRDPAAGEDVPTVTLTLTNAGNRPLWLSVLDLTDGYGVFTDALEAGAKRLTPGQQHTLQLSGEVTDEAWRAGRTTAEDLLRFVVATDEFDARSLELPELSEELTRRLRPADRTRADLDWRVTELAIVTVRPQPGVPVPGPEQPAAVVGGMVVEPHPGLTARVTLASSDTVTRDVTVPPLPAVLSDLADDLVPVDVSGERDTEGLDTIVLEDVQGWDRVSADQPLRIRLPGRLAESDHVLPLAWDGEFFLPLGHGRAEGSGSDAHTELVLERLPDPVLAADPLPGDPDERSLGGSIKILLRKLVGKPLGLPYDYPLLRQVEIVDGEVRYHDDPGPALESATSVLVYVHGIIGDTRGMSLSSAVTTAVPPPHLVGADYDVVLAFDYENINTTIPENASSLGRRLAAAGIEPGGRHQVDIVAHSMGGLVSRWYVELEGGHEVVRRLVTVGTPNAGSPWPNVQRFATVALTAALNGLGGLGLPATVFSALLAGVEKVDAALDEMQPGSATLERLWKAPDPGVPYTVVLGRTDVPDGPAPTGRWARLLARLSPRRVVSDVADLAFFGAPNDLAVSVSSGRRLPDGRTPLPEVREISCNHLSYFSTVAGLAQVADALSPRSGP